MTETFAILADIHGNSAALDAVLADMQAQGIVRAVNLGDHLSGPLDAAGTARRLMARDFVSIRGNHDRWLVEQDPAGMGASDRVAHAQLGTDELDWLRAMPATRALPGGVFLCHGTPHSDLTYWLERVAPDGSVRRATKAEMAREAEGVEAGLILCGHTHIPRLVRLDDGRMIVNPGSVGLPAYDDDRPVYHKMQAGAPHAAYAWAERAPQGWLITFRAVPYDSRAMVDLARRHGRETWAKALETGWISD